MTICIRLLQVPSSTTAVIAPISVGSCVKRTPRPTMRSYSAWTSSTQNAVKGCLQSSGLLFVKRLCLRLVVNEHVREAEFMAATFEAEPADPLRSIH